MTEKELRNKILLAIYKQRDSLDVLFSTFCKDQGFKFESDAQLARVLKFLHDKGYVNAMLYEGGDGIIMSITSSGVDFAEGLKALSKKSIQNTITTDREEPQKNLPQKPKQGVDDNKSLLKEYNTEENYQKIKDENVEPCFDIDKLAEGFVRQIDTASDWNSSNVCMIGIFAPWGRGKSYFFKKLKEKIEERNRKKNSSLINYDVVEFNAWKYQDTPAIWAYLFETIYQNKKCCFRFFFSIIRNWSTILRDIALLLLLFSVIIFVVSNECWVIIGVMGSGLVGLLINFFLKFSNPAISLIRRYTKGISFCNEMGVQAEIEKELASLLKFWITDKNASNKRVILYVDDIDRCSETKMIAIIDSLRTVLENETIRKRLIVICSAEVEKLKLGIEYKYKTLFDNQQKNNGELKKIANEQLDKIFITGISLSPLTINQQIEFLNKLAMGESSSETKVVIEQDFGTNKTSLKDQDTSKTDTKILSNKEIVVLISKYIKEKNSKLTPRKIRIIYYRILLANNIISFIGESKIITENITEAIFDLSCDDEIRTQLIEEQNCIVKMVVPYWTEGKT
jgi:hypothetical protein